MKNSWKLVVGLLAMVLIFGCADGTTSAQNVSKPNPTLKTVTLVSGSIKIDVELARTELEQNRGLMFRKSLAEGKGMLFVFPADQKMSFWMRNTSIPLSLAYMLSDGTIVQILDLVPFSEEPRTSERSIRYALEVPQGWFSKVGLKVGDRFELPSLK